MPKRLSVSIPDVEMAEVDTVLKETGDTKAAFVRKAIREAVLMHYMAQAEPSDPVEDWRKARGL